MKRSTLAVAIALLAAVSVGVAYAQGNSESQYPPEKVGVCHATGSETNPYVYLEVPENSAHVTGKHPDDIYPVSSAAECPAGEPPGGGTTVVTPPETTTPETTTPETTIDVTTPVLPALELDYICTSEGVDRFAVKNLSSEAVEVTFEDATGQQTFTVEGQGYYLVDGKVSRGSMPVAKLYYNGTLVDEVSVTHEACAVTAPPEQTAPDTAPEDTTSATPNAPVQDIGEPPAVVVQSPGPPAIVSVEVPEKAEPVSVVVPDLDGSAMVERNEMEAVAVALRELAVTGDVGAASGAAAQYTDVPQGAVQAAQEAEVLPSTGGTPLLLPIAALLLGGGLLAYRIVR